MYHKIEIMAEETLVIYYSTEKTDTEIDNVLADIQTVHITNTKQEHTMMHALYLILKVLNLVQCPWT
jgi:hypothetical protein